MYDYSQLVIVTVDYLSLSCYFRDCNINRDKRTIIMIATDVGLCVICKNC